MRVSTKKASLEGNEAFLNDVLNVERKIKALALYP